MSFSEGNDLLDYEELPELPGASPSDGPLPDGEDTLTDPSASLLSGSSSNHEDSPEFTDALPPDVQVDMPSLSENHTAWTSIPYTDADIPPTFDGDVRLPDPESDPVWHAAGVDTIRMTNKWFNLSGSYRSERSQRYPLTKELLDKELNSWRETEGEDGHIKLLSEEDGYYEPPDPRTLFVKKDVEKRSGEKVFGDPTNDKHERVWNTACREVKHMSDFLWEQYLGYTRQQLQIKADARLDKREGWLVLEIFKRYMVWCELSEGETRRAKAFEERQPTWTELEAFFGSEGVKEKGATFVDICHAFPYARDYKMLVYRIEHFAVLEEQDHVLTEMGYPDPVESRYMPKKQPSRRDIEGIVAGLISHKYPISVEVLQTLSGPLRVHEGTIRDVLDRMALVLDPESGYFVPVVVPALGDIATVLRERREWEYNGFTLQDLLAYFPNRVRDMENSEGDLEYLCYFDGEEKCWFPLYNDPASGTLLSPDESERTRNHIRVGLSRSEITWDRERSTYVPRVQTPPNPNIGTTEEFGGVGGHISGPGSPTETLPGTDAPGSPRTQPANTFSAITAVSTAPVVLGAVSPRATALPAEASSNPSVEGQVASPPAPTAGATGRRTKRGPEEEPDEAQKKTKKPKKASTIQCSRKTQKGRRCKNKKERKDGEDEWDCGKHKDT